MRHSSSTTLALGALLAFVPSAMTFDYSSTTSWNGKRVNGNNNIDNNRDLRREASWPIQPSSARTTTRLWMSSNQKRNRFGEESRLWSQRSASNSYANPDNILEDSTGHINRDLAERIWRWEQDRRRENGLPRLEYSVRAGLRLVEGCVESSRSGADSTTSSRSHNGLDDAQQSDLIQEGLTALLDAMSEYRSHQQAYQDFESYARARIRERLGAYQNQDRSVRVPAAVLDVVARAHALFAKYHSWPAVARELKLSVRQLQEYARLVNAANGKALLSMERTVQVQNGWLEDRSQTVEQDDWELQHGLLLDTGDAVQKDELIEEYLDEMLNTEGDDDAYVQQEQIAGPLPDTIPDRNTVEEGAEEELSGGLLQSLLDNTLNDQERKLVRARYGLDSPSSSSLRQLAQQERISVEEMQHILNGAMTKLRQQAAQQK